MTNAPDETRPLSRTAAQAAVLDEGWRLLLGSLHLAVPVASLREGLTVATQALGACDEQAQGHLSVDLRPDRVDLVLSTREIGTVTGVDTGLARAVSAALADRARPGAIVPQTVEIGVDALDIPAVRPFWKAVLAYVDEPGTDPADGSLLDPAGRGPAVWFQQMDAERPQRNRIHLDLSLPHDQAQARLAAAVAAGGRVTYEAEARAFWVLADPEGNEVCICTWQDRDPAPQTPPVTG